MLEKKPASKIAVVIATKDRPGLLSARALTSVRSQSRPPEYLVVVDDSNRDLRPKNSTLLAALELPGCEVTYLENTRSSGVSGSWNTAIDYLFRTIEQPHELFVAILDDDDAWAPSYLEDCLEFARNEDLDFVAADMCRIKGTNGTRTRSAAPSTLRAGDFLVGNPGIQGSNLFLRFSVLLSAGGFDEALPSTTDRDLCIRIADLENIRYGRLPVLLVDHFADQDRLRLSSRGSQAKLRGLTAFWKKYAGRMTAVQRRACIERATTLFDWIPPASQSTDGFVLGLVANEENAERVRGLLLTWPELENDGLLGLDVVLLEDHAGGDDSSLLDFTTRVLQDSGARCFRFERERQIADTAAGLFGGKPMEQYQMLQFYCGRVAVERTNASVWIVSQPAEQTRISDRNRIADVLRRMCAVQVDVASQLRLDAFASPQKTESLDRWIQCERVASAEYRVKRLYSLDDVRLLGLGDEAVVFTDEHRVFKCIDNWKTQMPPSQLDFLRAQVGRWADVPGLYALHEVTEVRPFAVLVYDYEPSAPFRGGQESSLIELLSGCRQAGIVCNNIHPKNLVVTEAGVRLIDYGSDIRPWSPRGFEQMARRAFLTCRYAAHPELKCLMRRARTDLQLPELAGYGHFRKQLDERATSLAVSAGTTQLADPQAPPHEPFALYVGVITSDPRTLKPLLHGLSSLRSVKSIRRLCALVLDNGSPTDELHAVVRNARCKGLPVALISLPQQQRDAAMGAFGPHFKARPSRQVGIAHARTMIQRYVGTLLSKDPGSFGWLLDDDMRVDARAHTYLPWLPAFRDHGVDALIGHYEGSSPNPPLNGLRVQLVDLFHTLSWLHGLPSNSPLPNRRNENTELRARYPDYYYDLSRKHTGHLETPHWLEPQVRGETVADAYSRLESGSVGLLNGAPLTRPLIANMPSNPLLAARDSVNRGGCTFILNHSALTQTPNSIPHVRGREARRSDMVWAIVNRYYRRMTIKTVGFPIQHVARAKDTPSLNIEKVQAEVFGSTLYAGLTDFLKGRPHHELEFSLREIEMIRNLAEEHRVRRLQALEQSFYRIRGLSEAIRRIVRPSDFDDLLSHLDRWFTTQTFEEIQSGLDTHKQSDIEHFLISLRTNADAFASATTDVNFIQDQLWSSSRDQLYEVIDEHSQTA